MTKINWNYGVLLIVSDSDENKKLNYEHSTATFSKLAIVIISNTSNELLQFFHFIACFKCTWSVCTLKLSVMCSPNVCLKYSALIT